METVPDELWSPDNPDAYKLVPDWAASMQTVQDAFTERDTNRSRTFYGPAAARTTAFTDAKKPGDGFQESDGLRKLWRWNGTDWYEIRGQATYAGNSGTAITGIEVPAAPVNLAGGLLVKTGQFFAATTNAFGNEYFPVVFFGEAFPTACVSVHMTPLTNSPVTQVNGAPLAIDSLKRTEFRAFIPNSPNPWFRAFLWTAYGY